MPILDKIEKLKEVDTGNYNKNGYQNCQISYCHVINPSKSSIDQITKVTLHKRNKEMQEQRNNQYRDSSPVTERYSNMKEKEKLSFLTPDIEIFYSSVIEVFSDVSRDFGRILLSLPLHHGRCCGANHFRI